MGNIRNVVFDFGGVLLDWNPRYLYRGYFKNDAEMEYFLANICNSSWNSELDRGVPFDKAVAELQQRHPEYSEAIGLYRDGWSRMVKGEIKDGVDLLRCIKSAGYNIFGLTNWSAEKIGVAYDNLSCLDLFDGIVVSGEEGVIKPDKRIFETLLARYNLRAEESIFIDDNPDNIRAAEQLGFNAILCDDFVAVNQKIEELLTAE